MTDDPWRAEASQRVQNRSLVRLPGNVPAAVIVRAEQLCRVLDDAAEARPDRQVMIAALIATAPADARKLAQILRSYRALTIATALALDPPGTEIVDLRAKLEEAALPAEPG